MFSLIKNEFIKLLHRPILYISIALIFATVFSVVFSDYKHQSQSTETYTAGMYDGEKEYYNNLKKQKNQKFMSEEQIDLQLSIIELEEKYKIGRSDWRYELISEYCNMKDSEDAESQKTAAKLLNFIEDNNYLDYCKNQLNDLKENLKNIDKNNDEYKQITRDIEKYNLIIDYNISRSDPRNQYIERYFMNLQQIQDINDSEESSYNWAGDSTETLTRQNKILLYRIKNNVLETELNKEANSINHCVTTSEVVTILLIIIATIVFLSEFSKKTIKHLIMCPYGRNKIIFSKLFVIITTAIIFYLAYFGLSLLGSAILLPSGASTLNCIIMPEDTIINMPFYLYTLMNIGFKFIIFLFYLSIILLLSFFTKNTAATLSVSLVCVMGANTVIQRCFERFQWEWLQYLPFVTCDFSQYTKVSYIAGNFNLVSSIIITVITIAALSILSFIHFKRIEV